LAHGALKAFLFLSSGSALQNIPQRYASLRLPAQQAGLSLSPYALALAWLPSVLMALNSYGLLWWSPLSNGLTPVFWLVVWGTSFLTAIYLFRGIALIEQNPAERRATPSGVGMLWIFGGVVTMGWAGLLVLLWEGFADFLSPVVAQPFHSAGSSHENLFALPLIASGIVASLAGWGLAHYFSVQGVRLPAGLREGYKQLYVVIHNKWYFDEIYDTFLVRPNLRFAQWLWRTVDVQMIERCVIGLGSRTVGFARWLWQSMDVRILGSLVDGIGRSTIVLARLLWQSVDIRGLERFVGRIGNQNEAAGQALREMEPSMLQHQLLVLIFSLAILMGLSLLLFH
jgi:NADH:ubiquinone oxidoreductase subunit 5 (subunit L)/multisubunit Na+/H+ antiporter MnhA subunit